MAVLKDKSEAAGASAAAGPEAGTEANPVAAGVKPGKAAKPEPVANEELVQLLTKYDENVEAAEASFIDFVEFIQKNQVPRPVVVASFMKARKVTFETAESQYSRMKKLLNNQEVLDELKAGKITLKVAREKTKTSQKNPASAKPEAKEQKYNNALKAFVAAAKEGGYSLKTVLMGVEAELKSAGVK
jgi:DNA-binding transcriptional regulator YhcF (GntR family)